MNIVTIDFDIIMAPNIELYNNWIEDSYGVDNLIKEHSILEYLKGDLYIYEYLTRFLMKNIKNMSAENIYFIEEHDTLVNLVKSEPFDLWNIDHHHDIFYDGDYGESLKNYNCGNWVKYLMDKYQIKNYNWICNQNSFKPDSDLKRLYPYNHYPLQEFNLDKLVGNIDKLFICKSSRWVPAHYIPLFDSWISICEEYYDKSFKVI